MSAYSEEIAQKICDHIADGNSVESAAKHAGIHSSTIYRWALGHGAPETFCEDYARATRVRAERMAEEILRIADDKGSDIKRDASGEPVFDDAGNPIIDHDNIQRAKLQIDTRKYLMGTWHSKKYSTKQQHEHTGADGGPIEHKHITKADEDILKLWKEGK